MQRREVAAVEYLDAVVVACGSNVVSIGRPIHAVDIFTRVDRPYIGPCTGVPYTNEIVLRARNDELAIRRIIHAVIIAAGIGGEFILIVWVSNGPRIVEVGSPVAVPIWTAVFVNG